MNIDITALLQALITLAAVVITGFVIPWVKTKTSIAQQEMIEKLVKQYVLAAEEIFDEEGMGKEKLDYVKHKLDEHGITYDKDAIEAAVYEYINQCPLSMTTELPLISEGELEPTEE